MLTNGDLLKIRDLMEEVLDEKVPGMVDEGVEKGIRNMVPGMVSSVLVPIVTELVLLREDVDVLKERNRLLPTMDLFLMWMDKIYGELQAVRESQVIQAGWGVELHDLGERVGVLEKHCGVVC